MQQFGNSARRNDIDTYVDTSVLVAYYCPEPLSKEAERRLRELAPPVISILTDVEVHSALAKNVRRDELTDEDAQRIQDLFRRHCRRALYHTVALREVDFRRAREWMAQRSTALRTLDALHLSVADRHDLRLLTADQGMHRAAAQLAIPTDVLEAPQ